MMEHICKIKSMFFPDVLSGKKPFELRKNDRLYSVGDKLVLFETDDAEKETGNTAIMKVTYILNGPFYGLMDGFCIMGIKRAGKQNRNQVGNHPNNDEEFFEYAKKLGRSQESAQKCLDYYAKTGWKMNKGLPIADWQAALRTWKDFSNSAETNNKTSDPTDDTRILLPLLLQEANKIKGRYEILAFDDPFIGNVVNVLGWEGAASQKIFDQREIIRIYFNSVENRLGTSRVRGSVNGRGEIRVPDLPHYREILKRKQIKR